MPQGCPRRTGSGRCRPQPRATISSLCLPPPPPPRCSCQKQVCTEETCANSAACATHNSEFCSHGLAANDGECRNPCHRENSDQRSLATGGSRSAQQNQPGANCCQPATAEMAPPIIASDSAISFCSSSCPVKTLSQPTSENEDQPKPNYSLCGSDCGAVEAKKANATSNSIKANDTNNGGMAIGGSSNQGLPQRASQSAESNGYNSGGVIRSAPGMNQAQGPAQQCQGTYAENYGTNGGGMACASSRQYQSLPQLAPQSAESNCCKRTGVTLGGPHMSQAQEPAQQCQGTYVENYGTNGGGMACGSSRQYQSLPQRAPQSAESNCCNRSCVTLSGPHMSQTQGPPQQGQGTYVENYGPNSGGMACGSSRQYQGLPQRPPQSAESNCCKRSGVTLSGPHMSQAQRPAQQPSENRRPSLVRIQDNNQKQNPLGQQTTPISSCCQKNKPGEEQGGATCPHSGGLFPKRQPPCQCVMPPAYNIKCTGNLAGNCTCSGCNQ